MSHPNDSYWKVVFSYRGTIKERIILGDKHELARKYHRNYDTQLYSIEFHSEANHD